MHLSLLLLGALLMAPSTTKEQWLDDIAKARVWEETDVSAKDLYQGPAGRLPFAVDDEVVCDFVPKPMSGWTPKFTCRLEDGTTVDRNACSDLATQEPCHPANTVAVPHVDKCNLDKYLERVDPDRMVRRYG